MLRLSVTIWQVFDGALEAINRLSTVNAWRRPRVCLQTYDKVPDQSSTMHEIQRARAASSSNAVTATRHGGSVATAPSIGAAPAASGQGPTAMDDSQKAPAENARRKSLVGYSAASGSIYTSTSSPLFASKWSLHDVMPGGRYLHLTQLELVDHDDDQAAVRRMTGPVAWRQAGLTAHHWVGTVTPDQIDVTPQALTNALQLPPYSASGNVLDGAGYNLLGCALMNTRVSGGDMTRLLTMIKQYAEKAGRLDLSKCGPHGQTYWHLIALRQLRHRDVDLEHVRLFSAVACPRLSPPPLDTPDAYGRTPLSYIRMRVPDGSYPSSADTPASGLRAARDALLYMFGEISGAGSPDVTGLSMRKSPIHAAIEMGSQDALCAAIGRARRGEFSIDSQDADGYTGFHAAVARRNVDAVRTLLLCGLMLDVHKPCFIGCPPILTAVAARCEPIVRMLADQRLCLPVDGPFFVVMSGAGAFSSPPECMVPLVDASRAGDAAVVGTLISSGANVNAQDGHGETALFVAAEAGHAQIVRLLAAAGADPSLPDHRGNTVLDVIVDRTLEEGAALIAHFFPGFVSPRGNKAGAPLPRTGAVGRSRASSTNGRSGSSSSPRRVARQLHLDPAGFGMPANNSGATVSATPGSSSASPAVQSVVQRKTGGTPHGGRGRSRSGGGSTGSTGSSGASGSSAPGARRNAAGAAASAGVGPRRRSRDHAALPAGTANEHRL